VADYAGVGSRIVAIIIDGIILWIITAALAIPFGLQAMMFSMMDVSSALNPLATIGAVLSFAVLTAVINLLYFTYLEGTSGQTLGKKLMSIKVTKEDGKQPTMTDAFVRTILRIIDGIAVYLLGFIVVIASEKKQRIGDMAAHTIVVKA
jgi:uncharacterized RDD family membrane protein YckC